VTIQCHQVAQFLRVNPDTGLFFFDSSYRPVPLAQQYIGISEPNFAARNELLNDICYTKVLFHLSSLQNMINLAVLANLLALAFARLLILLGKAIRQWCLSIHERTLQRQLINWFVIFEVFYKSCYLI